jgi:hypothetical protein
MGPRQQARSYVPFTSEALEAALGTGYGKQVVHLKHFGILHSEVEGMERW